MARSRPQRVEPWWIREEYRAPLTAVFDGRNAGLDLDRGAIDWYEREPTPSDVGRGLHRSSGAWCPAHDATLARSAHGEEIVDRWREGAAEVVDAMGHLFRTDLVCKCGQTHEGHQIGPVSCRIDRESHYRAHRFRHATIGLALIEIERQTGWDIARIGHVVGVKNPTDFILRAHRELMRPTTRYSLS